MASIPVFNAIDEVVGSGKTVISTDSTTVIQMVQAAVGNGISTTFYMQPSHAQDVRRWYFTPRRVAELGIHLASPEEMARITSELNVRDMGWFWSNRVDCPNGHPYGAFEFMQQGIREHGRDWVGAVLEFKNASVVRVNPRADARCPICMAPIVQGHIYWMEDTDRPGHGYGCCR